MGLELNPINRDPYRRCEIGGKARVAIGESPESDRPRCFLHRIIIAGERRSSRLRGHGASCLKYHLPAISTAGPSLFAAGLVLAEEVVVGGVRNEHLLTHVGGGGAAGSRSRSPLGV